MPKQLSIFVEIPTEVLLPVGDIIREKIQDALRLYPRDMNLRLEVSISNNVLSVGTQEEHPTLLIRLHPVPWRLVMPLSFNVTLVVREKFWSRSLAEDYAKTLTGFYDVVSDDDPILTNAIEIPFD